MRIKNINSFDDYEKHAFDNYTGLGYQYERHLLNRVISPELFGNPINDIPLRQIERLMETLVNQVKRIKLSFAFALGKNAKNLN